MDDKTLEQIAKKISTLLPDGDAAFDKKSLKAYADTILYLEGLASSADLDLKK